MAATAEPVILASASIARANLLRAAGVEFVVMPATIDETRLKDEARQAGDSAISCAVALAIEKACWVSRQRPDSIVIGADQVLALGAEWLDKPRDLAAAREQLLRLRGRGHMLATAVCVVHRGEPLWRATSAPELTMRRFSDAFLDQYLAAEGEALLGSVGAYRLEGRGVQLFSGISGDHFAVLGMPLVELLGFLRERSVIAT